MYLKNIRSIAKNNALAVCDDYHHLPYRNHSNSGIAAALRRQVITYLEKTAKCRGLKLELYELINVTTTRVQKFTHDLIEILSSQKYALKNFFAMTAEVKTDMKLRIEKSFSVNRFSPPRIRLPLSAAMQFYVGSESMMQVKNFNAFKSIKLIIKYLLLFGFIFLLAHAYATGSLQLIYGSIKQGIRSSRPITVTHIGGVKYSIPRDYILWGLRDVEDGFLIGAILPDMTGVGSDLDRHHHSFDQEVIIHSDNVESTTSFQFRLGVERKLYGDYQYLGEEYGLRHYRASQILFNPQSPLAKDPLNLEEIYTDSDNDASTSTLIDCNGDKNGMAPGCSIRFVDHNLLYQITIRKTRLSEWQSIKDKTLQLVDGFRNASVTPNQPNPNQTKEAP